MNSERVEMYEKVKVENFLFVLKSGSQESEKINE